MSLKRTGFNFYIKKLVNTPYFCREEEVLHNVISDSAGKKNQRIFTRRFLYEYITIWTRTPYRQ